MSSQQEEIERIVEEFKHLKPPDDNNDVDGWERLDSWLRTTLTTYGNQRELEAVEEIIQKIIDIEITKNNGDYELAQLKYREKVITAITKK